MVETIVSQITNFISQTSYFGITVLMALESANIPIPSEIIMTFSGFLAGQGRLELWIVILAGAIGNTVGSLGSYWLGRISEDSWVRGWVRGWGGFFITEEELDRGDRWLRQRGETVVLISRVLPVIRTFISFPAGLAKVNLTRFFFYTFVGSVIWSTFLSYLGFLLGENWERARPLFVQFDYLIIFVVIIILAWYIYKRGHKFVRQTSKN